MLVCISLFTVAIPVNYSSEFWELFHATIFFILLMIPRTMLSVATLQGVERYGDGE